MVQLYDVSAVQFLFTELQTGLTFAQVAQMTQPSDTDKIKINTANARKAYDSFLHFRDRVALSQEQVKEMEALLDSLKAALRGLGEAV